jgi:hypothetical protein
MVGDNRYDYTWPRQPMIALSMTLLSALIVFGATGPEIPWIIIIFFWGMAFLLAATAVGASLSTHVTINSSGVLCVEMKIYCITIARREFQFGEIKSVALDRQMTANGRGRPSTPRFRIDLHLEDAVDRKDEIYIVNAGSDHNAMSVQSVKMAEALGCPFQKTGVVC